MEWSIWPMSLRREGVANDYQQFVNLSIPFEKINVPTLAIHGNEDINVDLSHARRGDRESSRLRVKNYR